jgi:hypothetical protein
MVSYPPGLDISERILRRAAQRTEDLRVPGPESPVAITIIPSTPGSGADLLAGLAAADFAAIDADAYPESAAGEHVAAIRARSDPASQAKEVIRRERFLARDGLAAMDLASAIELDSNRAAELPAANKMLTRVSTALTLAICELSPEPEYSDSSDDGSSSPASSESSFGHSPRSPERFTDATDTTPLLGAQPGEAEADDTPDTVNDEFLVTPHLPSREEGSSRGGRVLPFHEQDGSSKEEDTAQAGSDDEEDCGRRYTREEKGKGRAEPLVLRPQSSQREEEQDEGYSEEPVEDSSLRKGKGRAQDTIPPGLDDPVQIRRADISSALERQTDHLTVEYGHNTWRLPDTSQAPIGLGYDLRAPSPALSDISDAVSSKVGSISKRARLYAKMDAKQLEGAEMKEVQMVSRLEVKLQEVLNLAERSGSSSTPDSTQAVKALKLRNSIARVSACHHSGDLL